MQSKKAQVWVETVIYTLIALVLIGTVLSFVRPKIEEIQDKLTIDQSLEMMGNIDSKIQLLAQGSAGNQRLLELTIKRGTFIIDSEEEKLNFILEESKKQYSEPESEILVGNVKIFTEKIGQTYKVTLNLDYSNYNITYLGEQESKSLTASPGIYKLSVANKGKSQCIDACQDEDCKNACKINLDFKLVN
jgi:type II secretory pathway pseudopilin PulG